MLIHTRMEKISITIINKNMYNSTVITESPTPANTSSHFASYPNSKLHQNLDQQTCYYIKQYT